LNFVSIEKLTVYERSKSKGLFKNEGLTLTSRADETSDVDDARTRRIEYRAGEGARRTTDGRTDALEGTRREDDDDGVDGETLLETAASSSWDLSTMARVLTAGDGRRPRRRDRIPRVVRLLGFSDALERR
jgi:hypothetical protein